MSTHDSITRRGSRRTWGARWRLAWRSLCAVVSRRPVAGGSVRAGRRERRRLSAIERALAADTPRLASMFEMFGQLAVGESHDGAERLTAIDRRLVREMDAERMVSAASRDPFQQSLRAGRLLGDLRQERRHPHLPLLCIPTAVACSGPCQPTLLRP